MIEHRGCKSAGYMAGTAILICYNMAVILADRTTSAAIMTGVAPIAHDVGSVMVDKCIEEISRVMAGSAIFVSVLMNCCIRRPSGSSRNVICTSIMA